VVDTRSTPTTDICSQSLLRAYFEGSEGAEGVLDHQVHFSVSQLETGDTFTCKWEPELHELPSKALQAQPLTKSLGEPLYPPIQTVLYHYPTRTTAISREMRQSFPYLSHSLK
jgi:hypothetical protein